jgi:outer membrane protein
MRWRVCGLLLSGTLLGAGGLQGQELSLAQALRQAAVQSFPSRSAAATTRSRNGRAAQTFRGLLPAVRMDAGYLRTTDPLAAFAAILRRRAVTPVAFDPAALNFPDAIGQLSTALVVEQPLLNADAWYARRAATRGAQSAAAMERWIQAGSQVDAVRAYYGAVLVTEQIRTLDEAMDAARAHQRQAESMHRNGLVTRSDVLLAAVRAGEVQSQLIGARAAVSIARMRLAIALGTPADTGFTLPLALPDYARIERVARTTAGDGPGIRGDVAAATLAVEAATADRKRATAQLLPRVNSFGRLDWVTGGTPFGGRDGWTVGIMLTWSPFTGGSELAERSIAEGNRLGTLAQAEAARAQGELELSQAAASLEVSLAQLAILDTAVMQSAEAHRIVERKYAGGLSTVVDLFDAAAQETATRLRASQARYDAIISLAERRRAGGTDLAQLIALEEGD